jgi:hypothetical protein
MEGELSDTILKFDYPRTIPAKFGLVWISCFRGEDLNVICYQNMPNLHNRLKSAERKNSQKTPEYMLNYSLLCSCSKHLSLFWLKLKQQGPIEECFIFSNSSHLEWRTELSDTILKGTHPGTIPAWLGLIWFSGFRGEDLNVKVYDVRLTDGRRTPSYGKSSHGLWSGELKIASHELSKIAAKLRIS